MSRRRFALYAIRGRQLTPLLTGFTPPAGTTPAQAAACREWRGKPGPCRQILRCDDQGAIYAGQGAQQYLVMAYPMTELTPSTQTHRAALAWLERN